MRKRWNVAAIGLVVLVPVMLAMPAAAGTGDGRVSREFREAYAFEPGMGLRLENGDGDVTFVAWDEPTVDITVKYVADYRAFEWGAAAGFDVSFSTSPGEVAVEGEESGVGDLPEGFREGNNFAYTYLVRAPRDLAIKLRGDDGSVEIVGWAGRLDVTADDAVIRVAETALNQARVRVGNRGTLNVEASAGELRVEGGESTVMLSGSYFTRSRITLGDGNLTVADCEGVFELETEDGDITVRGTRAEILDVRTRDGQVSLQLLSVPSLDLTLKAESPRVRVSLPAGLSARYRIDTFRGLIRLDVPGAERVETRDPTVSGVLHGGTGSIRIGTKGGAVLLEQPRAE